MKSWNYRGLTEYKYEIINMISVMGRASVKVAKAKGLAVSLRSKGSVIGNVFILSVKVLIDNVISLLVNSIVDVGLAVVDELHATSLFNVNGILVLGAVGLNLVVLTNLENVLKGVKSDLNNLVVIGREDIAERLDATLGNKVAHLLGLSKTTGSGVGKRPAGFLLGSVVRSGKQVNEWGD